MEAVLAARAPVRNAAVAIGEMDKLPAAADAGVSWHGAGRVRGAGRGAGAAGDPGLASGADREVRAARRSSSAARTSSSTAVALSQPFDDDGMAEYRLRLDPEGSAVLEGDAGAAGRAAALAREHGSDLRTSDQRRADALVEVCRRAAAAGGAAPATAKAAVVVTMGYQDLLKRTGAGTTLTGELLAPETVRKMACDAAIIPAVLGSKGQVLDLGRTTRLVTAKQFLALSLRDRGCTFPGCSTPTGLVSRTPRDLLARRRPDRPAEPGPALPAAPHDRAPARLHRHRHRARGDLAPVPAPPRDPPPEAGRQGTSARLSKVDAPRRAATALRSGAARMQGRARLSPPPARTWAAGDDRHGLSRSNRSRNWPGRGSRGSLGAAAGHVVRH